MISPFRRHQMKVRAALATGVAAIDTAPPMPSEGPVATEYEQLRMALGEDLRRLQSIQSTEKKIAAKRQMFPAYLPWIEGALAGDGGAQDDIVAHMAIWAIDIGDWKLALDLAAYMLRHKIALPERFKRQPATIFVEEFAEAGLGAAPTIDLEPLQAVAALTKDLDVFDEVRAKLEKALGLALQRRADTFDPEAESAVAGGKPALIDGALTHFRRALALDAKCGVKTLIRDIERAQAKAADAAQPGEPQ